MTFTVDAAETTLSELLLKVQAGDTIILTSGSDRRMVAKLEPLTPPPERPMRLGFLKDLNLDIPDSFFFDPVPDEWTGRIDDPDDPLNWSSERIISSNASSNQSLPSKSPTQAGLEK